MTIRSSEFGGGRRVAAITNAFSGGGTSYQFTPYGSSSAPYFNLKEILSGALTANTLLTVLSISGRGALNFVSAAALDTTSRTVRLQIIIDGTTIFDATSDTVTSAGSGIIGIGAALPTTSAVTFQPIRFYSTCIVKIASSITETDKLNCCVNYETDL